MRAHQTEGRAALVAAAAPPEAPPMTAEEALRQAEVEGLTLVRSESSSSGYTGVSIDSSGKNRSKPYQAKVKRGGKTAALGYYATAEEAALVDDVGAGRDGGRREGGGRRGEREACEDDASHR